MAPRPRGQQSGDERQRDPPQPEVQSDDEPARRAEQRRHGGGAQPGQAPDKQEEARAPRLRQHIIDDGGGSAGDRQEDTGAVEPAQGSVPARVPAYRVKERAGRKEQHRGGSVDEQ